MLEEKKSWISQYMDFMLARDFESGLQLKMDHFPERLFKYRPLNDYTLESLEYNSLWLAEIDSLNDPFECLLLLDNNESLRRFFSDKNFSKKFKDKFNAEISNAEINTIVKSEEPYKTYSNICDSKNIILDIDEEKQKSLIQNRWEEIIKDSKKNIRICSFSERNDSLLMWSHYANQHMGICVEYDFEGAHDIRAFLQPAFYSDKLFIIKTMEDLNVINHLIASLTKSKDWEYEEEWRLTVPPDGNAVPVTIEVPVPKAIYLGPRFDLNVEYKKKQFLRICKSQNIPIFQMKIHPTEYKLIKTS
jgi:hypothetical protein